MHALEHGRHTGVIFTPEVVCDWTTLTLVSVLPVHWGVKPYRIKRRSARQQLFQALLAIKPR